MDPGRRGDGGTSGDGGRLKQLGEKGSGGNDGGFKAFLKTVRIHIVHLNHDLKRKGELKLLLKIPQRITHMCFA